MPNLMQSLQGHDVGHLRIIAELCEFELQSAEPKNYLEQLAAKMVNRHNLTKIIEALPQQARLAWNDLINHQGRLPWAQFTRRYGDVREMGPARRDRERPYLTKTSPAEILWYRALIARSFLESQGGPEEYAYIPDDLLSLMATVDQASHPKLGQLAAAKEIAFKIPVNDQILDDACTILASLRIAATPEETSGQLLRNYFQPEHQPEFVISLLKAAGLLDREKFPLPDAVRSFLEASRADALLALVQIWMNSQEINELHLLPDLKMEGEWRNDPYHTRQMTLDFLRSTHESSKNTSPSSDRYVGLTSFIHDVRENYPDFQRSGGEYDSWFIRNSRTGEQLRGFESWIQVEGAYLRYMILGPLHWLGIVDLAYRNDPELAGHTGWEDTHPVAFRLSRWGSDLIMNHPPPGFDHESAMAAANTEGRLNIPRLAPRAGRYQIARFAHWEGFDSGAYRYLISPQSLERAAGQDLKASHLVAILRRYTAAIPPSFLKALERWDEFGREATIESATILRLKNPELLPLLRTSRAGRFLGETLGPGTVLLRRGGDQAILNVLAELGYFGDVQLG